LGANSLARLGEREHSRQWSEQAVALAPNDPVILYNAACNLAQLSDPERALDELEHAIEAGVAVGDWIKHDPDFEGLRDTPALPGDRETDRASTKFVTKTGCKALRAVSQLQNLSSAGRLFVLADYQLRDHTMAVFCGCRAVVPPAVLSALPLLFVNDNLWCRVAHSNLYGDLLQACIKRFDLLLLLRKL
jgi:hypothetical protein